MGFGEVDSVAPEDIEVEYNLGLAENNPDIEIVAKNNPDIEFLRRRVLICLVLLRKRETLRLLR
jgi:hypothetical protein